MGDDDAAEGDAGWPASINLCVSESIPLDLRDTGGELAYEA